MKTTADDGAILDLDRKSLKKMFPNLVNELNSEENKVSVNSVRTDPHTAEKAVTSQKFVHYMPDVIDFIRRCDNEQQAEEIIAYMEKQHEIEKKYAEKLRKQLKEKGVRSFGPKKEEGYYLNHGEP
jgi:hypothetical protein